MSYLTQSRIASDETLRLRVTACAAAEHIPDPAYWAQSNMWELSASPGWVAAYMSAIAAGITDPGSDESVITDAAILSAVQALHHAESPPE